MITRITLSLRENSSNTVNNTTNVTVTATIEWNSGSWDYYGMPVTFNVDGVTVDYKTGVFFNRAQRSSGSEDFYSWTGDIKHNDNGQKTLSCELIYHTNLMGGTRITSGTWPLTPIPRASTIAATSANIGEVSMITVNRKCDSFTHEIECNFQGMIVYITDADGSSGQSPVKLSAVSIPFTVDNMFYQQIPNATEADCVLTCTTYSGDTRIGEPKTCKFRVSTNPSVCRPVVKGTVTDINASTVSLTGDKNVIVAGASTAQCYMTAEIADFAEVTARSIGGVSVSENSRTIHNVDMKEVEFVVTDSRGYTGKHIVPLQVIPYVRLTCLPEVKYADITNGVVRLTVKGRYYTGSFGKSSNSLVIHYTAETENEVIISEFPDSQITFGDNSYTATVEIAGYDYRKNYSIHISAEDSLTSIDCEVPVKKGMPVFDWGENDFKFNVPVRFMDGPPIEMIAASVVECGVCEGGYYRRWSNGLREYAYQTEENFLDSWEEVRDPDVGVVIGYISNGFGIDSPANFDGEVVSIRYASGEGEEPFVGTLYHSNGGYKLFSLHSPGTVHLVLNVYGWTYEEYEKEEDQ